ncbi:hypothetical protein MUB24_04330 [Lederbergia sp. NSJ-179]|uniref:hypothetical protein n=1 Tax=Lederbergia sp. NSJ-179 TaxID=2931402 RepID=UPI001FD160F7|nr:hypothetical protein [Lederbergia sp. NSJ-179]MCJ7840149.1 hypothetical protein [Lederbergia sp. NSJ-179]
MITEIENYYETTDFALLVTYHLDLSYLNGKSEEEYGGWTIGYKMPNHSDILIAILKERIFLHLRLEKKRSILKVNNTVP